MKVLVVEDELQLADAIARGLCREGMAVDTATDGDLALEKAALVPYDVIVLDRDLPLRARRRRLPHVACRGQHVPDPDAHRFRHDRGPGSRPQPRGG